LDRKVPALFTAHRADDIGTALRLVREFQLTGVLDAATEGYLIADEIARAKLPVLVHPTMQRVSSPETMNTTLANAAILADRGVCVSVTSSFEGYVPKTRVPLYEAAIAMTNGLGYDRALRSITIDAARTLGIDQQYGSLERGKVADLVVFDGDPFEYATHVTHVIVDGRVAYDRAEFLKHPRRGLGVGHVGEPHCCEANF
jgi:imidazolonepropionase-like amidohydrolase